MHRMVSFVLTGLIYTWLDRWTIAGWLVPAVGSLLDGVPDKDGITLQHPVVPMMARWKVALSLYFIFYSYPDGPAPSNAMMKYQSHSRCATLKHSRNAIV